MFSVFAKLLLVLTAIAPVAFVYSWVMVTEEKYWEASGLAVVAMVLVAICIDLLKKAATHLERMEFRPTTVEAADRENIAFLLLYVSPLFAAPFGTINLSVIVPTIIVFGILTATGYSYHFNPLLGIMGWHFYKVTSEHGVTFVLITKKHLRRAGEATSVGQLTDYILIDLEK